MFDLVVSTPIRPQRFKTTWESLFAAQGFEVEIYPQFSPDTWEGGFLPFRVVSAPVELIGLHMATPCVSGFEVDFTPESACLQTSMGRTTTEFALQCIGAATLAQMCGGQYIDNQNGLTCNSDDAQAVAIAEIKKYLSTASDKEKTGHEFPGWEQLE